MEYSTLAAADLGSNCFHLAIGRVDGDQVYPLDSMKETVRLATGLTAERTLDAAAQERALKALKRFSEGKLPVLVATDVAARGLDIDELDIVIQADPPPDPKTYLHRSGRTARAGAAGLAVTLVLWNEELEVRRLKRRLSLDEPIVEMFSNDERLADLANWNPAAEGAA